MMTPAAVPANRTAHGLDRPMSLATSAGKPKIPLLMIELITSAARLHRPIARTSPDCSLLGKTWLYHSDGAVSYQSKAFSGKKCRRGVPLVRRPFQGCELRIDFEQGPVFGNPTREEGRFAEARRLTTATPRRSRS